jgi:hypothetical protein
MKSEFSGRAFTSNPNKNKNIIIDVKKTVFLVIV